MGADLILSAYCPARQKNGGRGGIMRCGFVFIIKGLYQNVFHFDTAP